MTFTVKQARQHIGYTQDQMAEKFGVCRDTYRKIENNPELCTVAQAKQLALVTGISLDQIFFGGNSTFSGITV